MLEDSQQFTLQDGQTKVCDFEHAYDRLLAVIDVAPGGAPTHARVVLILHQSLGLGDDTLLADYHQIMDAFGQYVAMRQIEEELKRA